MAFYDFKEKQGVAKDDGENKLYASIVYNGTISAKQLIRKTVHHTTFSVGELEGALAELLDMAAYYIGEGYHVELGEFGFFSGKIKARHVADRQEIRSQSIRFDGVNFRASKTFRMKATGDLERSPNKRFYKSRIRDEEDLKRILLAHLDKNGFITRTTYSMLTGRMKNTALADLKTFVDHGLIQRRGHGNQLHFVPAAPPPSAPSGEDTQEIQST